MTTASRSACMCDRCGCHLDRGALRYEMRVGVRLSPSARLITEEDLGDENLREVASFLGSLPEFQPAPVEPEGHHASFILCPSCCRRWRRDPLGLQGSGSRS